MLAAGGLVGLLDGIAAVARGAGLDEQAAMSVYAPLARQALANAERLGVDAALSGPFLRGDVGTVRAHLEDLQTNAPQSVASYVALARASLGRAVTDGRVLPIRARRILELLDAAETARPALGATEVR